MSTSGSKTVKWHVIFDESFMQLVYYQIIKVEPLFTIVKSGRSLFLLILRREDFVNHFMRGNPQ